MNVNDIDDKPSVRVRILYNGAKLTDGDRDKDYGSPVENMQDIGSLWMTYLVGKYGGKTVDHLQFTICGEDVAHMMTLMKIARTYASPKYDNYVDGATYQAIAGECADEERNNANT